VRPLAEVLDYPEPPPENRGAVADAGRDRAVKRRRIKPCWNSNRNELWFGETLCKSYRQRAPNQWAILDAFASAKWPQRIDDPLRPTVDGDDIQRLRDAVRALNDNPCIHFELDGTSEGILWRPRSNR
jgi:hypothetical protein